MALVSSFVTSGITDTNVTVSADHVYFVELGGVMSGTTVDSGGLVIGLGGILSAGTSLTANAGEIGGDLTIVGNVDNTGQIGAAVLGANTFADMLITGGTMSGPGGLGALATFKSAAAFLEISDEIVSGGTFLAAGKTAIHGYAQISVDDSTVSGATLETTGGGFLGVFGGYASGTTPVSTTIDGATIRKSSLIFDDGVLTFNGGTAQAGVTFWDKNGLLTLSGLNFGAGDLLSASASGQLDIDNSANVFSAGAIVEASDNSEATLSGGLANAGTIWALASAGIDTTADVTVSAGNNAVTNSKTGIIEAESLGGGYFNSAAMTISGSGSLNNAGSVVAYARGFGGTAYVSLEGGTVANTGATEALAISNAFTKLDIYGISGVANGGIMMASASIDAQAYLNIFVSGGTVSNTKTIEALAPNTGQAALLISDESGVANLVNAKGATILASANLGGKIAAPDFGNGLDVEIGGSIVNSGTIAETVNNHSDANFSLLSAGANIVNAGNISATAAGESQIAGFSIDAGSSFVNSGTGTVAFAASNNSFSEGDEIEAGAILNGSVIKATATAGGELTLNIFSEIDSGSIVNTGTIGTTATAGGSTYVRIEASGSGASIANSKLIEASATGAGSVAGIGLGGDDFATGGAVTVNNAGGTLEAAASAGGMAYIDLGSDNGASIVGGTLKTTGEAALGVFSEDDNDAEAGSATNVTIAADSNIVAFGFEGSQATLVLSSIVGSIGPGTSVEAAYGGEVDIYGNVTNGGNIAAVGGTANFAPGGAYAGDGTVMISAGSVTNTKTMAAIANASQGTFTIDGNVRNTGMVEAAATAGGVATFDIASAGTVVNSGTMLVSAHGDAFATLDINGAAITNTKAIEALASDLGTTAAVNIVGTGSASTVSNSGTLIGLAQGAGADIAIVADTILNAANRTIGVSETDGSGSLAIEDVGGTSGSITNAGFIVGSAAQQGIVDMSIDGGGNITNAAGATIELIAAGESHGGLLSVVDSGGPDGTIYNSGILLASAGKSSDVTVNLSNVGGTIVNTRLIELVATSESIARAFIVGSSIVNSGTIEAVGGPDSAAEVSLDGTVTNSPSGVISASANGSIWLDDGTTIVGGTLRTSGSEAEIVVPGGTATIESATIAKGTQVFAEMGGTLVLGNGDAISGGALVDAETNGTVIVAGGATITNAGTLLAGDRGSGTIVVSGVVNGSAVEVGQNGAVDVRSGGTASVAFGENDNGTLVVADSSGATGASSVIVYGFGGIAGEFPGQLIDLGNVAYTSGFTASYSLTSASANAFLDQGTVTVTSGGSHFAVIDVVGYYTANSFNVVSATNGTVAIDDPISPYGAPQTLAATGNTPPPPLSAGAATAALLGSYMAAMFASAEGQIGSQATVETAQAQTLLVHPHSG